MLPVALCAALCAPMFALAQTDAGPDASPEAAAQPTSEPDIATEAKELLEAYRALRDRADGVTLRMGIAALVGAGLSLLIAVGRRFSAKLDSKRKWLPWVLLGIGVIVGISDQLSTGIGWAGAFASGGGPPLAILLHQLVKNTPGKKSETNA